MGYVISNEMKLIIEKKVGMPIEDIYGSSFGTIDTNIEKKLNKKLQYSFEPGHSGRGNVLIMLGKIIWPNSYYYKYYKRI